jgi:hypothetical protein
MLMLILAEQHPETKNQSQPGPPIQGRKANWAGNLAHRIGSLEMLRQVVAEQHLKMRTQRQPEVMKIQMQRCKTNLAGNWARPGESVKKHLEMKSQSLARAMKIQSRKRKRNLARARANAIGSLEKCGMLRQLVTNYRLKMTNQQR